MNFYDFNLRNELLDALDVMGFKEATPVQEQAIPLIMNNKDLIACAQTGTGKTAAFLLPVIDNLIELAEEEKKQRIRCLIVVPTRELAKQIYEWVEGFAYYTGISSCAVYGGSNKEDWSSQKTAITQGAEMIISTPGRLLQHLNLGYVDLKGVRHFVLDEADKMLEMGFVDDILKISSYLPKKRQNLMFSATMPKEIRGLAKKLLNENSEEINIATSKPAEGVNQKAYLAYDNQKMPLLESILKETDIDSMIIFAARKSSVNEIAATLKKMKFNAGVIHSDRDQSEREKALRDFSNKKVPIIVATDIISRGIDVDNISHVLNYDCPNDPEDYIHRVGRTARHESTGEAITFINPPDINKFRKIEKLIEKEIPKIKLPGNLGPGPDYRGSGGGGGGGKGRGKKKHYGKNKKRRNPKSGNRNKRN